MEIRTIGIDLGKTVFHLAGVNRRGEVVVRKKCSRTQLLGFTSKLRYAESGSAPRLTRNYWYGPPPKPLEGVEVSTGGVPWRFAPLVSI